MNENTLKLILTSLVETQATKTCSAEKESEHSKIHQGFPMCLLRACIIPFNVENVILV